MGACEGRISHDGEVSKQLPIWTDGKIEESGGETSCMESMCVRSRHHRWELDTMPRTCVRDGEEWYYTL